MRQTSPTDGKGAIGSRTMHFLLLKLQTGQHPVTRHNREHQQRHSEQEPRICPECEGNGRTETKLVTNIHEDTIILVLADCTGIFYHRQYGYDINRHDPESRFFSTREEAEKYLEEEGNK